VKIVLYLVKVKSGMLLEQGTDVVGIREGKDAVAAMEVRLGRSTIFLVECECAVGSGPADAENLADCGDRHVLFMEQNRDTVLEGLGNVRRHTDIEFVDLNGNYTRSPKWDLGMSLLDQHSHTSIFSFPIVIANGCNSG
jgi:hypothetical protein